MRLGMNRLVYENGNKLTPPLRSCYKLAIIAQPQDNRTALFWFKIIISNS